jgi:electron transport complex protein RnfG
MNETIKLGLTLMIVTLIASLALALTNHYTSEKIEMQKEFVIKESLDKVITADSFKEEELYYDAYDKDLFVGRVLKVEVPGYSSTINALVGINLENEITGIDIISHQETPGLGADIEKDDFLAQFIGKTKDSLKIKKDGGEIDGITGATISSRAITEGVRKFMEECACDALTSASPKVNETGENETE